MKKRRIKVFFTLDPDIHREFEKICDEKMIKKSSLFDKLLSDWIEKQKTSR